MLYQTISEQVTASQTSSAKVLDRLAYCSESSVACILIMYSFMCSCFLCTNCVSQLASVAFVTELSAILHVLVTTGSEVEEVIVEVLPPPGVKRSSYCITTDSSHGSYL